MKPKILTVDDSKTIRLIVTKAFKPFDCEVFEASNGVEGLAVASRERPDLVILDLTMPIMDGVEMLSRLKSDPELKTIPVVMLTAEAGRENVLRIARMGVRDYLVKPFREEALIERVGRIIDLKPKGDNPNRVKRFDDPLSLLLVDDKPAILELLRTGMADTNWKVAGRVQTGEAVDYCTQNSPDVILISLSLPDNAGFNLFQMFRASAKMKNVPVFALCVKTAVDEQSRAQQAGFTAIVTKPIDLEDLKGKIARALHLDTSYKYFQQREGVLVLTFPSSFNSSSANEISTHLRSKVAEAVDSGLGRMVIDLSMLKSGDLNVIKLCLSVIQLCEELSLKQRIIGSEAVCREFKNYEETKDWRIVSSFEQALSGFSEPSLTPA
ncbi:MAG: response regulator [Verrucomicrobiota bacterium]